MSSKSIEDGEKRRKKVLPSWTAAREEWQAEQALPVEISAAQLVGRALYAAEVSKVTGGRTVSEEPAKSESLYLRDFAWGTAASIVLSVGIALPFSSFRSFSTGRPTAQTSDAQTNSSASSVVENLIQNDGNTFADNSTDDSSDDVVLALLPDNLMEVSLE